MRNVTRRHFLKTLGATTASLTVSSCRVHGTTIPSQTRRPNIVIIISDDHGLEDAGCYGNTVVQTPNIDQLASEGMKFNMAFTATAMCAPSRSMLYTGLFPHRNGAHPNHSSIRPGVRTLPHYMSELGYKTPLAGKTHIKPRQSFPFEYMGLDGVDKYLAKVGGEPFCLVIATNDPHGPYKKAKPGEGYDPAKVELPPYLVDTPETRQLMANYYNSVADLDEQVGKYLTLIEKYSLKENTLFIYASDHGSGFPFAKWTLYDAGLNVPFIARWPGHIKGGTVTDAMISFVDVLPTFIEAVGGTPPEDLDGRSFLAVLEGKKRDHREFIFATHTTKGIISGSEYPVRAMRTRTHKYIRNLNPDGTFTNVVTHGHDNDEARGARYWKSWVRLAESDASAAERVKMYQHRPAQELYDLRTDPYERNNIAGDVAHKELIADLRARLKEWMKQQGDPELGRMG